ncbi:MAG: undecaprenyl-phosphate galactose phosphotransferase WbaP [Planctomycetaceae bacterium]|nr:undecaprenyl-phosphate galactose phosphotransferase WbaP [Planctomycetaceae bacterium]
MSKLAPSLSQVVSTDVIAGLDHVVHAHETIHPADASADSLSSSIRLSGAHWKQVVLTSSPLIVADAVAILLCFWAGSLAADLLTPWNPPGSLLNHMFALLAMYVVCGILFGLYPASGLNPVIELRLQVTVLALTFTSVILLNALVGVVSNFEVTTISLGMAFSILVAPVVRYTARYLVSSCSKWGQPVIIVGASSQGRMIHRFLQSSRTRGLRTVGVVDIDMKRYWTEFETTESKDDDVPFLGTLDELREVCHQHHVYRVIAILIDRSPEEAQRILTACSSVPTVTVLSSRLMLPSLWTQSYDCIGFTGIQIHDRLLSPVNRASKRLLDILIATIGLVISLPIFAVAAVVLSIRSPGPVFYGHPRTGHKGLRFKAWKIRTMVTNAAEVFEELMENDPAAREEWNRTHKLKRDPRIVGGIIRLLRRTSLDELPQLWNVLKGEMSLVGPRPLPDDEIERYGEALPVFMRVRPGITGLWQVSGRNNTAYDDKVRLDIYYVRNWSLWLDYYIVLRTLKTVILREGAY